MSRPAVPTDARVLVLPAETPHGFGAANNPGTSLLRGWVAGSRTSLLELPGAVPDACLPDAGALA